MKVISSVPFIIACIFSLSAHADTDGGGSNGSNPDPSYGCQVTGEFVADATAAALLRGGWAAGGVGAIVAAGLAGVTAKFGPSAVSAVCSDGYDEYWNLVGWIHNCDFGPCIPPGGIPAPQFGIDSSWLATTILNAYDPNNDTKDWGITN